MRRGTLKAAVVGGIAGAFVVAGTAALAGTGIGGVFNLGQSNFVNAPTKLSGSTSGPQLQVSNSSADEHSIVATAQNGAGVALYGVHTGATGMGAGVRGQSAAPYAPGVLGVNTANGPGLSAMVTPGHAPLHVNSNGKVPNLNADLLDGRSSSAFLPSTGSLDLWTSPFEYTTAQAAVGITPYDGPHVQVRSSTTGSRQVFLALNTPAFAGATFNLASVTVCFASQGAPITGTLVEFGTESQSKLVSYDTYTHSSPSPTCYDVAPSSPLAVDGVLYLRLDLYYASTSDYINLYPVKATFTS
jgi:hypothetical protein